MVCGDTALLSLCQPGENWPGPHLIRSRREQPGVLTRRHQSALVAAAAAAAAQHYRVATTPPANSRARHCQQMRNTRSPTIPGHTALPPSLPLPIFSSSQIYLVYTKNSLSGISAGLSSIFSLFLGTLLSFLS